MKQEYTDYKIAIYYSGQIVKLSHSAQTIPDSDIKFIIHCEYIHPYKDTSLYKNTLFNERNERIEDNTFIWKGIKCKIEELECWADVTPNWRSLAIVAHIWDKFDYKKTKVFENRYHNSEGFVYLFEYINILSMFSSHEGVREVNNIIEKKDYEIGRLKKQIEYLKK